MKVFRVSQNTGEYNNSGLNFSSGYSSVPSRKALKSDVFERSCVCKPKPSFSGLPFKKIVDVIRPPRVSSLLSTVNAELRPTAWFDSSIQSRTSALSKDLQDTFTGLFGAKLKGKKELKINKKLFDIHRTPTGAPVFVERGGNLEISVSQKEGRRLYSVIDKKTNAQLIQDGASSYKMIIPDGEYTTTVNTVFTKNDVGCITSSLRTTKDAAGRIVEVSEVGNNGHEYVYNFLTNTYSYKETGGKEPFYRIYKAAILNPEEVAYSQSFVNEAGFVKIKNSMAQEGWTREPIHVVKMNDGQLVSLDNRRLRAATETNTPIRAIIHDADEELSPLFRVRHQIYNPETNEVIAQPKSWGEAIYNRLIQNGFVSEDSIRYSSELPLLGNNYYLKEGSSRLFEAYRAGRLPVMSYMA